MSEEGTAAVLLGFRMTRHRISGRVFARFGCRILQQAALPLLQDKLSEEHYCFSQRKP